MSGDDDDAAADDDDNNDNGDDDACYLGFFKLRRFLADSHAPH